LPASGAHPLPALRAPGVLDALRWHPLLACARRGALRDVPRRHPHHRASPFCVYQLTPRRCRCGPRRDCREWACVSRHSSALPWALMSSARRGGSTGSGPRSALGVIAIVVVDWLARRRGAADSVVGGAMTCRQVARVPTGCRVAPETSSLKGSREGVFALLLDTCQYFHREIKGFISR
jgi:hypothetical protein